MLSDEEKIILYIQQEYGNYDNYVRDLLDLYNNEKEKNKKLEETKNKLVRYIAIKEGKDYEQVCREFEI